MYLPQIVNLTNAPSSGLLLSFVVAKHEVAIPRLLLPHLFVCCLLSSGAESASHRSSASAHFSSIFYTTHLSTRCSEIRLLPSAYASSITMRLTRIFAFLVATVVLVMAMPVDEQSLSMTDADTTTNEVEVTDMHDMTQLGDQLDEAIGVCGKVYYAVPIMSPYPIPSQNILGNDKCHDARRSFAKWQLNSNCACVFYT